MCAGLKIGTSSYLELLAKRKVRLDSFYYTPYGIDRARDAYEALKIEGEKPLMVLLEYPLRPAAFSRRVEMSAPVSPKADKYGWRFPAPQLRTGYAPT